MLKRNLTRIIACLLASILLISMMPVIGVTAAQTDIAEIGVTDNGLYSTIDFYTGEVKITGYGGSDPVVVIPEEIDTFEGLPVTRIDDNAFIYCKSMSIIVIPTSITHIGDNAFYENLTAVYYAGTWEEWNLIEIGSGNEELYNADFYFEATEEDVDVEDMVPVGLKYEIDSDEVVITGYTGSAKDLVIPAYIKGYPVTSIVVGHVLGFGSDVENIYISEGVTSIGDEAFSGSNIKSITLPDSLKSIGERAFSLCTDLQSITIPAGVNSIGDSAFSSCTGLTSIDVDEDNNVYDSRDNCNAIIETETNTLIVGCDGSVIPEGVEAIEAFAFRDNVSNITIPETVKSIDSNAFSCCSDIESISVDVDNRVYDSRNNCNAIIETATDELIVGCSNTSIPEGTKSIGVLAFSGRKNLESITIPAGVKSIGYGAFDGCENLIDIYVPKEVERIRDLAFLDCNKLMNVYYAGTQEEWDKIEIGILNDDLEGATIHFEYGATEPIVPPTTTAPTEPEPEPAGEFIESEHNYSSYTDKIWEVKKPGADYIVLDFSADTFVEYYYDYIYIYDGNGNQVGSYTGSQLASKSITVNDNVAKVRLVSDGGTQYYGFYATYEAGYNSTDPTEPEPKPAGEYIESEHIYSSYTDKIWEVKKPGADNITLKFSSDTYVEDGYDYIYIYNEASVQVGKYTGSELASKSITVNDDVVKIRLVSDGSGNFYGFYVAYEATYNNNADPTEPTTVIPDSNVPISNIWSIDVSNGEYPIAYGYNTVVFSTKWRSAYIYAWSDSGELQPWPGIQMKYALTNEYGEEQYVGYVPSWCTNYIISGDDGQTIDLDLTGNVGMYMAERVGDKYTIGTWDPYFYGIDLVEQPTTPAVTVPETTAPETTAPETTAPKPTEPETTEPIADNTTAPEEPEEIVITKDTVDGMLVGKIGDSDNNGVINIKDATNIQKYVADIAVLSAQSVALSDSDGNEKVNIKDATAIQKYIAGIEVTSNINFSMYITGTHKHNYVESVVAPSCTKGGYTAYSCICSDEYKDNETEAAGHKYKSTVIEATCSEKGYTLYECTVCGNNYKDNYTSGTGAHEYKKEVISPTGNEEGYTRVYCVNCSFSYREEVDESDPPVSDSNNYDYCDGCGNRVSYPYSYNGYDLCYDCYYDLKYSSNCDNCGTETTNTYSYNNKELCYSCYYDMSNSTRCELCRKSVSTTYTYHGYEVCYDCYYDKAYTRCSICGTDVTNPQYLNGEEVCSNCYNRNTVCEHCGRHTTYLNTFDGKRLCSSCYTAFERDTVTCRGCGKRVTSYQIIQNAWSGLVSYYCYSCYYDLKY